MAILNITEDSFSDGGLYVDLPSAINHASFCIKQGAHILDIGAQSTRPGASDVGAEIEIKRLVPLIKELKLIHPEIPISVDTFHHSVAKKVLKSGANWINDVSGGRFDNDIFRVVADFDCPYVITHSRGNSRTMSQLTLYEDIVNDVINELKKQTSQRLLLVGESLRLGIKKEKIHKITKYDPWFIEEISEIIKCEGILLKNKKLDKQTLLFIKSKGFSDKKIARLRKVKEVTIRR